MDQLLTWIHTHQRSSQGIPSRSQPSAARSSSPHQEVDWSGRVKELIGIASRTLTQYGTIVIYDLQTTIISVTAYSSLGLQGETGSPAFTKHPLSYGMSFSKRMDTDTCCSRVPVLTHGAGGRGELSITDMQLGAREGEVDPGSG